MPAEEWVELANGCLCCSVKSDFVAALEGLMLKRDKFDYILIETTGQSAAHGLAHPAKLSAVAYITQYLVISCICWHTCSRPWSTTSFTAVRLHQEFVCAGLADPGPVAAALWTDDELEAAVHLDAIVTVVDAKNIQRQLQEQHSSPDAVNEAQKQIAYADSVLLNKVSCLSKTESTC